LPLPLGPLLIVTHAADEVADHVQPPNAVTSTVPAVAPAGTDAPAGVNAYVQVWPAWFTVKL
jgi:hypothetical protein